jgi:glycosyltransferase involved in cell wall biosynthesis
LAIAGDGPEREALQERANSRGVAQRVKFLGAVERDSLPDMYASADAFVFPSVTETQGLVLTEALAAGTLVIAADAAQIRDVLGGAGRAVAATPQAFAAAMDAVPETPAAEEAVRARNAVARFSIEEQARKVHAVYASLRARDMEPVGG